MNPIFIKLGPIEIRYYGLMYAIAFLVGIHFAKKAGKKIGIKEDIIENFAFTAIISGLIGARAYYVLLSLDYYLQNPMEIPAVWHGGLAIHGGIIGGFLGSLIFAKKYKLNLWTLTDIASPLLLFGQGIGRIGNFMNGEVHGVPTFTPLNIIFSNNKFAHWYAEYQTLSLEAKMKFNELVPWGIVFPSGSPAGDEFPETALHPAMLYEMVLNLIGVGILVYLAKTKNLNKGIITMIYIILYSLIRIFVSFFRAEDLLIMGMRAPHLTSLVMIVLSVIGIIFLNKSKE